MNLTFLGQDQGIFLGCNGGPFRQVLRVNSKLAGGGGGIGIIQGKGIISALSVRAFGISQSLIR